MWNVHTLSGPIDTGLCYDPEDIVMRIKRASIFIEVLIILLFCIMFSLKPVAYYNFFVLIDIISILHQIQLNFGILSTKIILFNETKLKVILKFNILINLYILSFFKNLENF